MADHLPHPQPAEVVPGPNCARKPSKAHKAPSKLRRIGSCTAELRVVCATWYLSQQSLAVGWLRARRRNQKLEFHSDRLLGRIDFTLDRRPAGGWMVVSKKSRLIPVTQQTAAAPDLMAMAKPYEEAAERYLNTPVARSARELSAARGREEDTAVVDLVQRVQLYYAKADVSFTALYNPEVRIPQGQVTVRQIAALYPYDNELLAIQGTGKMVKDALENAARYFSGNAMPGFNYDMAAGVEYEIDRSRPEGDRIVNLRWRGK